MSIGIFWFIPQRDSTGEVFGVCEPYKLSDNTRTGLLDSNFEHWQVWEQCPGEAKLPAAVLAQEYFHFPRGRVLFDLTRNRHRIYCDPVLLKPDIKEKIKAFFRLQALPVVWMRDLHYTTQTQQLDQLWDDSL